MGIINRFFNSESCDIHLNHGDLLDAIWSWIGVKVEQRWKVAEVYLLHSYCIAFGIFLLFGLWKDLKTASGFYMKLLSLLGTLRPQSSERKSKWVVIRRQLRQVRESLLKTTLKFIL